MVYEEGSYLKELEAEHQAGRHNEKRDDLCPTCTDLDDEDYARQAGFSSNEEYQKYVNEQCRQFDPELEADVVAFYLEKHAEGKHEKYPSRDCPTCVEKHGRNNI